MKTKTTKDPVQIGTIQRYVLIGAVASFAAGYVLLKRFPVAESEQEEAEEVVTAVPGLA